MKNNSFNKQSDFLNKLKEWGFKVNKNNNIISTIKDLIKFHKLFESKRFNLDYDIDGLVYKVNDLSMQSRLGLPLMHQDGQLLINFLLITQIQRFEHRYSNRKNWGINSCC